MKRPAFLSGPGLWLLLLLLVVGWWAGSGLVLAETLKVERPNMQRKGFTPEVEASYRQKNPSLNYAQVDEVERFRVNPTQLAAFIKEGGLTP
ncbi:MAG: hypothetical protein P8X58_05505 [Syntrophobacterales bacterium]